MEDVDPEQIDALESRFLLPERIFRFGAGDTDFRFDTGDKEEGIV